MQDICFGTLLWDFKMTYIIKNDAAYTNMNNNFLSIAHIACDQSHK